MATNGGITIDGLQRRTHMGHSHAGHHHHHDNTFLTSKNKDDPGVRITRIGLFVNLGMAIAKGAGGIIFHSQALAADALHALTDLVSDIMTLATISYSLRPPTERFPLGYGKIESLGALAVSGLLLSGGLAIGIQAILALSHQFLPDLAHALSFLEAFGHSHSHDHGVEHAGESHGPHINAAWLAGGSIIIKEWLYRATIKIARQKRSNVLESNAYHHRVDSLTSIVALVTISASQFFHNAAWLDPVGGLLISGMIVQAGWGNTKAALLELADVSLDHEVRSKCDKIARDGVQNWNTDAEIRGVQGIKSGQNFLVDVEVAAPARCSLVEQSELESSIRQKLISSVRGVHKVTVRFVVRGESVQMPFLDQFANDRQDAEAGADEQEHEHGHGHHGHSHVSDHHIRASDKKK